MFNMQNKKRIIIILVLIAVVIVGIFLAKDRVSLPGGQEVSTNPPVDITLDFYDTWLLAAQAADTDPYQEMLLDNPLLGSDLRDKLASAEEQFNSGFDPVLCQTGTPEMILARPSYQLEEEAEVIVLSRDEGFTGQSIAKLTKLGDGWYISDISCSAGEFGEEREFSLEAEGYVLKNPELDGLYFIFAEDGVFGQLAPLMFGTDSVCRDINGNESACNPDSFGEKTPAVIRGEMTESGANVKQMDLVESLSFE